MNLSILFVILLLTTSILSISSSIFSSGFNFRGKSRRKGSEVEYSLIDELISRLEGNNDKKVLAACIEGVSQIIVAGIHIYLARFLLENVVKTIQAIRRSSETEAPRRMDKYLPESCSLSSYELELLNSAIDPTEISRGFDYIGGFEQSKSDLRNFAVDVLSHDLLFNSTVMKPSQSMLLYGPPGNGKTSLIQAISSHFNLPMISIVPSLLQRKYYGESNQMVKALFSLATKLQPCILFIDEVDSLLRSRSDSDQDHDRNLKIEFMQLWDDIIKSNAKVIVFGSTNRPQDLDPAIHRRFERSMLIPIPSLQDRIAIFRTVFACDHISVDLDFNSCARLTEGYTASDITNVCRAATSAVQREYLLATKSSKLPTPTALS
jgi:ATPase family AAA domain-containing protein 1